MFAILLLAIHLGTSISLGLSEEPKAGSCWSAGFNFEHCCAPEHGPSGNSECWDDVYTYEACCASLHADPAEAGCGSNYFQRFKGLVTEYYTSGRASPGLIDMFPRLLGNFEARLKLCAPAALLAMLLQLEERAALEPAKAGAERLAAYALRLQEAVEEGYLSKGDARSWPLEAALQRVRQVGSGKAERHAGVGRGPTRERVALVLSYCNEDLAWMNASLSRRVMRHVELVVVQKCAVQESSPAAAQMRLWRRVRRIDVEDLPLRADECSAYFGYLFQEYEMLPGHMVFAHADAPEHIGGFDRPNIIDDTLRALLTGVKVPFAHLGGNRVTMRWDPATMTPLWRRLFASSVVPKAGEVQTYCCSHFVVSRERVRLRPRGFFFDALNLVSSPKGYWYLPTEKEVLSVRDVRSRLVCQNMMFLWHVVFGEGLENPHRMFDAKLPLFLKMRNVRTAYMDL